MFLLQLCDVHGTRSRYCSRGGVTSLRIGHGLVPLSFLQNSGDELAQHPHVLVQTVFARSRPLRLHGSASPHYLRRSTGLLCHDIGLVIFLLWEVLVKFSISIPLLHLCGALLYEFVDFGVMVNNSLHFLDLVRHPLLDFDLF